MPMANWWSGPVQGWMEAAWSTGVGGLGGVCSQPSHLQLSRQAVRQWGGLYGRTATIHGRHQHGARPGAAWVQACVATLDWGKLAGWLEAGDSMVQAGPRAAAGTNTNLEGGGLDQGGARSWLRADGPGATAKKRRRRNKGGCGEDGSAATEEPATDSSVARLGSASQSLPLTQAPPPRADWPARLQGPAPAYQTRARPCQSSTGLAP